MSVDNVSDHRSQVVGTWWAQQQGRVTPLCLPAYTPTLNLMERIRRFLTQHLTCHHFWNDVAALERAATTLFRQLQTHVHAPTHLRIILRNNFREAASNIGAAPGYWY